MSSNIFDLPTHPVADNLPMEIGVDMEALVASIKEFGQLVPIVVQGGMLIDGRCRREACRRLGIEPRVIELADDQDPRIFWMQANLMRQHLSRSQCVMATALLRPERAEAAGDEIGREALLVAKYQPGLAKSVMGGAVSLNDAYAETQEQLHEIAHHRAQLEKLHRTDPHLAREVVEAGLDVQEAAMLGDQRRAALGRRRRAFGAAVTALENLSVLFETGEDLATLTECCVQLRALIDGSAKGK